MLQVMNVCTRIVMTDDHLSAIDEFIQAMNISIAGSPEQVFAPSESSCEPNL